jgi:chromosomal replication initiation ATPase DnaA
VRLTDQPSLPLSAEPSFVAVDFRAAPSNAAATVWLNRTADWPDRRLLLWGEPGCGKTHLLNIWATRTGAAMLAGAALRGLPELPPATGIAIDAADTVADETALFHLLNAAGEAGLPVLLAARSPPSRWTMQLPDLASRLRAMTAVAIGPPEDALLHALLARLLDARGLRLPSQLLDWLLLRLPRSAAAVRDAVVRLDEASMDQHRTITAAFARDVLADLLSPEESAASTAAPSRYDPTVL